MVVDCIVSLASCVLVFNSEYKVGPVHYLNRGKLIYFPTNCIDIKKILYLKITSIEMLDSGKTDYACKNSVIAKEMSV